MRAPMIPPTTPQNATAFASASDTRAMTSFTDSQTPKKMPTAVKIPCHARVIGPRWMLGSRSMTITALPPVALLELLPRAAPAGVVAADLLVRVRVRARLIAIRLEVGAAGARRA